jgi:hypothetical protein
MVETAETRTRRTAGEYLRRHGTEARPAVIHERVAAAFTAVGRLLDTVSPAAAPVRAIAGEWSVQEIVDHLLETHRPGVDELRCLLAGQSPPGDPIPAGLQSKAPRLRPWLLRELTRVDEGKAYAITRRLHALDHLARARRVLAAR